MAFQMVSDLALTGGAGPTEMCFNRFTWRLALVGSHGAELGQTPYDLLGTSRRGQTGGA